MSDFETATDLLDFHPTTDSFHDAVVAGLSATEKMLPCKYFYDETGSQLFDQICELDEYYVTRTEQSIMQEHVAEMAMQIGPRAMLVEYGSGSSLKTRSLLRALSRPAAYVPIDISKQHLRATASDLCGAFPQIPILPVCADFTCSFELPVPPVDASHVAVYFPGSTIGNFTPSAARRILDQIAGQVGSGGGLLIGIDLQKDHEILCSAYDDADGITAAFNLNLLDRIERELDASLDCDGFEHRAIYNESEHRIEMQLVSQRDQVIRLGQQFFPVNSGESITTEYSHKYSVKSFERLAAKAGFSLHKHWIDANKYFAVLHLVVES